MSHGDWQHFAKAVFDRLHLDIDLHALSGSSTILDLYFASVYRFQLAPIRTMETSCIRRNRADRSCDQTVYLH
jgi:hypothetical protein